MEPRFENAFIMEWLIMTIIEQTVIMLIPLITLLIVTIRLINALRIAKTLRHGMQVSAQQTQEHILTRTVVTVLLVFTACQSTLFVQPLVFLYRVVLRTECKQEFYALYKGVLVPSLNICLAFNSSINFVIYSCE